MNQSNEQDNYEIVRGQGIRMARNAAKQLQGASPDVFATTLFNIINKIEIEAEKHGIEFELSVLLAAAGEILEAMIQFSKSSFSDEEKKRIIGLAVGQYLKASIEKGKLTKDDVMRMAQEAQGMNAKEPQRQGILEDKNNGLG